MREERSIQPLLRTKTRCTIVSLLCLLILITIPFISAIAVTIDPDLDSNQLCLNDHFRIYYTTDCTSHPDICVTLTNVDDLCLQLEDLLRIYTSGDYGFNDPTRGRELPVQIRSVGGGKAYCSGSDCGISLTPRIFTHRVAPLSLESIPSHEMFHLAQWTYGYRWRGFIREGTAQMMQDKVYIDLDQSPGTEMASYFGRANSFLNSHVDKTLINISYSSCLFWTYFTEQYGTVLSEPELGVDAIRILMENYRSGSDAIQRVNGALDDIDPGKDFQDMFMDFIVANYAKDLPGVSVPEKYKYRDDDTLPGAYNRPKRQLDRDMPLNDVYSVTDEIRSWAAKYYEIRPSPDATTVGVDFHNVSSVDLVYNLLVIKDGDLIMDQCEFNVLARDFVRSIVNEEYNRIVVIVGALTHPAAYRYTVDTGGVSSTLNILLPTEHHVALVGRSDLYPFHVHLEIVGPGGSVMSGLEPDDFEVTVDGTSFLIITGLEVMGQYWLVVQPVLLPGETYPLTVTLAGSSLTDTENDAIMFVDNVNEDKVFVIDRSGSMLEPDWTGPLWEEPDLTDKIYGAIDAATLYVNSSRAGDKMGLVWFSSDAFTPITLCDFDESTRSDFIEIIDSLDQNDPQAWRATSIGDGLWNAQDELDRRAISSHIKTIILLSDGIENRDRMIEHVVCDECKLDYKESRDDPDTTDTFIHTVALGSDADREKLERLAHASGGLFEYVVEPRSGDLPNDLADIYRIFSEAANGEQRTKTIRGEYKIDKLPYPSHYIYVEKGASEVTFVVNYNWKGTGTPRPVVTLIDPDGCDDVYCRTYDPLYTDDTHDIFRISLPQWGNWTVKLDPPPNGVEFWEGKYFIESAVKSNVILSVKLGISPEKRIIGTPVPIFAFLTHTQPVTGAEVELEITTPELELHLLVLPPEHFIMRLYDNGRHGDSKADDGIYTGFFYNTDREGIYDFKLTAEGSSPSIGNFSRETRLACNMKKDLDSDSDGLPDGWEALYGLDPYDQGNNQGADADPDSDGLTNIQEFENGTNPMDPDSDDGGESDGSEVSNDRDPHNPEDDAISPPTSLQVIPGINFVKLLIGFLPEHQYLKIYRSTSENGPWQSFQIQPSESYDDQVLENGTTYYYKVIGIGELYPSQEGIPPLSAPTVIVSVTPKSDPIPPMGYVIINNGATYTQFETVTLNLWADQDTKEMKISNDPNFAIAEWEPFSKTKTWNLVPGKGLRTVYAIFKDESENTGPRSPTNPSAELEFAMDSILLGQTYIEDTDRDGIKDSMDNCPLLGNPEQHDTDRDGAGDKCDQDDDNDRLPDVYELNVTKTDPLLRDTDKDGIVDGEEDQDNDGFSARVEYMFGSNPCDGQSIPENFESLEIPLSFGWNMASLALDLGTFTAEDLCDQIAVQGGEVVEIDIFKNGFWKGHICGLPFNNFHIKPGCVVFIKTEKPSTWTQIGSHIPSPLRIKFKTGWNVVSLPLWAEGRFTAHELIEDFIRPQGGDCSAVYRLKNNSWLRFYYFMGRPVNDFVLVPGEGYFFECKSSANITIYR